MNKIFYYIVFLVLTNRTLAEPSLVTAAKDRLKHWVVYDGSYQIIPYPNGDVNNNRGVCSDVIIRSYRKLDIDLQRLVHEDMLVNFNLYPQIWGLNKADKNIDHRRVPNLERFLQRHGVTLKISNNPKDYQPGDIVSWRLANNLPHIGIVSNTKSSKDADRYKIIHNIGLGPKEDDVLFTYKIFGHFRYKPD